MNKYLRQNWKIWNHIRFRPIGNIKVPHDPKKMTEWAEKKWEHIVNDDSIVRHSIHNRKGKAWKEKYTITVLSDIKYCYIIQVLRTEFNTDNTTVFMRKYSDEAVQDCKNIAKFIHRDIGKIVDQSLADVKQFNELTAKQELANEKVEA